MPAFGFNQSSGRPRSRASAWACLLEDRGVAGERVDILGDPVTARLVGRDRRTAHHEDRGCDPTPPEPGVELVEQVGGLRGGELVPAARHAVIRSRAGT